MKKILLIEDDPSISLAIGMSLKAMGYGLSTAADAAQATKMARDEVPDVVVVDINLPGGDGFIVVERLRRLISTAVTPIVMITASKKPGLRERAEEMGISAFLEKPFDVGELSTAIENAMQPVSGQIG